MTATLTRPRTRKPPQPVHGSCRWVEPLGPNDSAAVLAINGVPYVVSVLEDDVGRLLGYRLEKPDGTAYDIDAATWTCDCPDATFCPNRPQGCKHSKALRAALADLAQSAGA